jgi:Uma2 family endonuclease
MVLPDVKESGKTEIVATDISFEDYLEHHAEFHREWVDGTVIQMPPIGLRHEEIRDYLRDLLRAYFSYNRIGRVIGEPFVLKLPNRKRGREPDLFVVLHDNSRTLHDTYMEGAADIVIEVLSPATQRVDRGDKFDEYEGGGVQEYWIIDPVRNDALLYRLNSDGVYMRQNEDGNGNYTTPLLRKFRLHVPTLWQPALPDITLVVEAVRAMWEAE